MTVSGGLARPFTRLPARGCFLEMTGLFKIVKILLVLILLSGVALAGDEGGLANPERIGAGLTLGHSYDPAPTFGFLQLTGVRQYDYDRVWPHRAPKQLFFKVEGSLGLADFESEARAIVSVNILAQYYLAGGAKRLRPYLEAGIGLIYTDFQVGGQGLRFNFNPQAGLGCDIQTGSGDLWFTNLRIHHLSNGDLYRDNRGVNSVLLQVGKYF